MSCDFVELVIQGDKAEADKYPDQMIKYKKGITPMLLEEDKELVIG